MNSRRSAARDSFSIASNDDEEKRRRYLVDLVRDDGLRRGLEELLFRRDIVIQNETESFAFERDRVVEHILQGKVKPPKSMQLPMDEMRTLPPLKQRQLITAAVDRFYRPAHTAKIRKKLEGINEDIDGEIELALDFEKTFRHIGGPGSTSTKEERKEAEQQKLEGKGRNFLTGLEGPIRRDDERSR